MFRENLNEKQSSRKVIRCFEEDIGYFYDFYNSLYTKMFIDDLSQNIMPMRANFDIRIEPSSNEVEELIKLALSNPYEEPQNIKLQNITEVVCDFIKIAAHNLACYGKAYYEIVYFYTDEKKQKIDSFAFENIPNHCIKEIIGFYWQYIPQKIEEQKINIKRFNWIPKNNILVLCIPKQLGGVRKFRKLVAHLQCLSKHNILKEENIEFFLAKETSQLGWTARGMFNKKVLEFYQNYRYLKFELTKAVLREYIIHRLNYILEKIGRELGFNAKIIMEGTPSSQDYKNYVDKLLEGSLQFSEVFKLKMS